MKSSPKSRFHFFIGCIIKRSDKIVLRTIHELLKIRNLN